MKKALIVLSLFPLVAFAGKTERDYWTKEVTPAVKTAETDFKKACGCALKINVDEKTIKSTDDMYQAKHIADSVKEGAPTYCTDAASKKAVCQMKTLEISKTSETKFTFAGTKGTATTDGQAYTSWDMMTQQLDK